MRERCFGFCVYPGEYSGVARACRCCGHQEPTYPTPSQESEASEAKRVEPEMKMNFSNMPEDKQNPGERSE